MIAQRLICRRLLHDECTSTSKKGKKGLSHLICQAAQSSESKAPPADRGGEAAAPDEAKEKTPDLRLLSKCKSSLKISVFTICITTERLGEEDAKMYVAPKRRKVAYPIRCCRLETTRLADHLNVCHNLKGEAWKPTKALLLRLARTKDEECTRKRKR